MTKPAPPKRTIRKKGIPLDDRENARFLTFVRTHGQLGPVERFLEETGLYLRGRHDGPNRSGTEPCGYVFVSQESFDLGHRAILFFDPMPLNTPLNVSFYRWKSRLPFDAATWNRLQRDRLQENMRVLDLSPEANMREAIRLARLARETFSEGFDLTALLA